MQAACRRSQPAQPANVPACMRRVGPNLSGHDVLTSKSRRRSPSWEPPIPDAEGGPPGPSVELRTVLEPAKRSPSMLPAPAFASRRVSPLHVTAVRRVVHSPPPLSARPAQDVHPDLTVPAVQSLRIDRGAMDAPQDRGNRDGSVTCRTRHARHDSEGREQRRVRWAVYRASVGDCWARVSGRISASSPCCDRVLPTGSR